MRSYPSLAEGAPNVRVWLAFHAAPSEAVAKSVCGGGFQGLERAERVRPRCASLWQPGSGRWKARHKHSYARSSDRRLYKMRELRGAGVVTVKYLQTAENTADIFTKVLQRQPFEKHRKVVLNLPGGV